MATAAVEIRARTGSAATMMAAAAGAGRAAGTAIEGIRISKVLPKDATAAANMAAETFARFEKSPTTCEADLGAT
jgi:hypothetical protein